MIILVILLICLIAWVLSKTFSFLGTIITLSFLPSGIMRGFSHRMMDGSISNTIIPIIGGLFNYITVLIINIIDFFCWLISFIPLVNLLLYTIYRSPDFDLVLGVAHRNFISHSVLNPVFLVYVAIVAIVVRVISRIPENILGFIKSILLIIGLSFVGHLLADTMPAGWKGFAMIKIAFTEKPILTLPAIFSKLWLYLNAIFSGILVTKACDIKSSEDK